MDLKYYIDLYKESGYIIELRKYIGNAPIMCTAGGVIIENESNKVYINDCCRYLFLCVPHNISGITQSNFSSACPKGEWNLKFHFRTLSKRKRVNDFNSSLW